MVDVYAHIYTRTNINISAQYLPGDQTQMRRGLQMDCLAPAADAAAAAGITWPVDCVETVHLHAHRPPLKR